MSSNLPPGVTESMIPGFRPQDVAAQQFAESIGDEELLDWLADGEYDRPGCVLYLDEDTDVWLLESDQSPWLPSWGHEVVTASNGIIYALLAFESREDALSYVLTFHDDEVIAAMAEEHVEELADGPDDY